jgi:hypothetical protein
MMAGRSVFLTVIPAQAGIQGRQRQVFARAFIDLFAIAVRIATGFRPAPE